MRKYFALVVFLIGCTPVIEVYPPGPAPDPGPDVNVTPPDSSLSEEEIRTFETELDAIPISQVNPYLVEPVLHATIRNPIEALKPVYEVGASVPLKPVPDPITYPAAQVQSVQEDIKDEADPREPKVDLSKFTGVVCRIAPQIEGKVCAVCPVLDQKVYDAQKTYKWLRHGPKGNFRFIVSYKGPWPRFEVYEKGKMVKEDITGGYNPKSEARFKEILKMSPFAKGDKRLMQREVIVNRKMVKVTPALYQKEKLFAPPAPPSELTVDASLNQELGVEDKIEERLDRMERIIDRVEESVVSKKAAYSDDSAPSCSGSYSAPSYGSNCSSSSYSYSSPVVYSTPVYSYSAPVYSAPSYGGCSSPASYAGGYSGWGGGINIGGFGIGAGFGGSRCVNGFCY